MDAPQPVILIIADISGYTRFMVANAQTLVHAQAIVTELLEAIIHEVDVPLRVSKLEGDAVFLYAVRGREADDAWSAAKGRIATKLVAFFDAFTAAVARLSQVRVCKCDACAGVSSLRLKAIVHAGEALVHRVGHFEELAGVDVIVVHRLLKNSVEGTDYILMTEAARRELGDVPGLPSKDAVECYDDVGDVKTCVFRRGSVAQPAPPAAPSGAFAVAWSWTMLGRSVARLARPDAAFHNVPAAPARGRVGMLAFLLLIEPFVLLAMLPVLLLRGLRTRRQ
jgi:hypothetical protein